MGARELRTLVEGGAYFEGPRWHEGRWWVSDFYRHGVFAITPDGAEEQVLEVDGPAVRARMDAGRVAAGRLDARARAAAPRAGRRGDGPRRPDRVLRRAPQRPARRRARPRLRGQLRLRPDELRRSGGHEPGAGRPRRLGARRGRRPVVPERHRDRRRHADRGRDVRRAADRVHDRGRRLADRPPRLGPDRADRRARHGRGDAPAPRLRARRLHAGRRGPHLGRGRPRRADVPDRARRRDRRARSSCPTASARSPACSAGRTGATLLLCAAPDFIEANRKDAREAVLLTTTVDVPHGGRP